MLERTWKTEKLYYVDTNSTYGKIQFTNSSAVFSNHQANLPSALHSEVFSCVRMESCSNSTVFYSTLQALDFRGALIIQDSHYFIQWSAQKLAFFWSFCKVFSISTIFKKVLEPTLIQISTFLQESMQVSLTSKNLFLWVCLFTSFLRTRRISVTFPINRNSHFPYNVFICKLNI